MMILVPSRGRPGNIAELIRAFDDTCAFKTTHLAVLVDRDDPEVKGYLELPHNPRVTMQVDERRRLGGTLNHYGPLYTKKHDVLGFMGDDHRPRTFGWDARMVQYVLNTPLGITYGNDLIQGANIPTAVVLDSRIVAELGFMVPPGLIHLFMDNFWKDLGIALDTLQYQNDVVIEHVHPIAGKAQWDDTYKTANANWDNDRIAYDAYLGTNFPSDVSRLLALKASL